MNNKPHIVVIGAGLAGLATARALSAYNCDVTILEARDRIGGRTWTENVAGVQFDHGAFVLHGLENNPMAMLAKELNLPFVPPEALRWLLFKDHKPIPDIDHDVFETEFETLLKLAKNIANSQAKDCSLMDSIQMAIAQNNFHINKDLLSWQLFFFQHYYGMDVTKLSGRHWDDEEQLAGGNNIFINGYGTIAHYLAKDLNITLNSSVNCIDYQKSQIQVHTQQKIYAADAVVVTLPLGILKNSPTLFMPELPPNKQQALDKLDMGVLNKIMLVFPQCFWPKEYSSFGNVEYSHDISFFLNNDLFFPSNALIAATAGEKAKELEKLSDQETAEIALESLRNLFGNNIPKLSHISVTRWFHDPFTHGSYSYIPIGSSSHEYQILAEPVDNRLFFAGEATHAQYPATTHGAYLSGVREAKKIVEKFNLKP